MAWLVRADWKCTLPEIITLNNRVEQKSIIGRTSVLNSGADVMPTYGLKLKRGENSGKSKWLLCLNLMWVSVICTGTVVLSTNTSQIAAHLKTTYRCFSSSTVKLGGLGVTVTFFNIRMQAYMPSANLSTNGTTEPSLTAAFTVTAFLLCFSCLTLWSVWCVRYGNTNDNLTARFSPFTSSFTSSHYIQYT